jgi:hypothetical protein
MRYHERRSRSVSLPVHSNPHPTGINGLASLSISFILRKNLPTCRPRASPKIPLGLQGGFAPLHCLPIWDSVLAPLVDERQSIWFNPSPQSHPPWRWSVYGLNCLSSTGFHPANVRLSHKQVHLGMHYLLQSCH